MPFPDHVEGLTEHVMALSCDDQHKLAARIAANIGYALVREDDPHVIAEHEVLRIDARLDRLDAAVLEMNPGLNWP